MLKKKLAGTAATLLAFVAIFVDAALASEGRRWPFDVPLFFLAFPLLVAAHRLLRPTSPADERATPPSGSGGEPRNSAETLVAHGRRRRARQPDDPSPAHDSGVTRGRAGHTCASSRPEATPRFRRRASAPPGARSNSGVGIT